MRRRRERIAFTPLSGALLWPEAVQAVERVKQSSHDVLPDMDTPNVAIAALLEQGPYRRVPSVRGVTSH